MKTYLNQLKETCPSWLFSHSPGKLLDVQIVLHERILYYPGSGFDGQPIETFNAGTRYMFLCMLTTS